MRISQVVSLLGGSLLISLACASSRDAVQALTADDAGSDSLSAQGDAPAVDTSNGPETAAETGSDSASILDAVLDALDGESDAMADGTATAGTRIKPINETIAFADGAKLVTHVGWWDSDRSEACEIATAADGKQRCMPIQPNETPFYTDATCATVSLWARLKKSSSSPKYVSLGAGPMRRLAPVTGDATNPAKVYYLSPFGAGCSLVDFDATTYQAIAVGPEIPASTFVEAVTTIGHD